MYRENDSIARNAHRAGVSRRNLLRTGVVASAAGALAVPLLVDRSDAKDDKKGSAASDKKNDIMVLNGALYYEHQAIWAYSFAAGKLTTTAVGKAVLALALRNQADHKVHRDTLSSVITSLGGMPVKAESSYDVSSYIKNREGNVDSDVNIAKLALALEVDAAIAYGQEVAKLKTPALVSAGASIGSTETAHATAIRAAFKSLGVKLELVPAAFVNADNRKAWILSV